MRTSLCLLLLAACGSTGGPDGSVPNTSGRTCANFKGQFTVTTTVPEGCTNITPQAPFLVSILNLADGGISFAEDSSFTAARDATDACIIAPQHPRLPKLLTYDPASDSAVGRLTCCTSTCAFTLTR